MILRHLKSHNGACREVRLQFNGALQRFTALDSTEEPSNGERREAIAELWGRTAAAADDAGDEREAG